MQQFDKSLFTYTPLFCEENIWKLIESFQNYKNIKPVDVIFVINKTNSVALFEQQKSIGHKPVIWDYHVILAAHLNQQLYIFDFDSRCNFPTEINKYFYKTFIGNNLLPEKYRPLIKNIASGYFFRYFSSDRKHMLKILPESEFPDYKIIQSINKSTELTLENCLDVNHIVPDSQVLTPDDYLLHIRR